MRLYELFKDVKIKCSNVDLNMIISGIASDSRCIKDGNVYVAIKGEKRDGNAYIESAISNGAKVIVSEYKNQYCNIPFICVQNAREALAKMWNAFYYNPTKDMKIIAITGTNGKTSSAYILYSILRKANKKCGLISTIECLINDIRIKIDGGSEVIDIPAAMTTPDPSVLYRLFYEMKNSKVEYVVMEASSHALSQHKLAGANIHIGAFTNLSAEHLDYHKNIESYFNCKKELFKFCKNGIINIDDTFGKILKKENQKFKTFSMYEKSDFYAEKIEYYDTGCRILSNLKGERIEILSTLTGLFMPYNIMLAVSCAKILNIDNNAIKNGVLACNNISGRMEKIHSNIYIDYAHTPKAMENVLLSMKEIHRDKRIIALFGCGGDRDRDKRAIMGEIASKHCDEIIITSDNSRTENPVDIINDIALGLNKQKPYYIIPNRKDAIYFAVKKLQENEILLLLGKGHEKYEIDCNGKHYFNEKEIVKEALNNV